MSSCDFRKGKTDTSDGVVVLKTSDDTKTLSVVKYHSGGAVLVLETPDGCHVINIDIEQSYEIGRTLIRGTIDYEE